MKRILSILFAMLCTHIVCAQNTEGTEFWLTFMSNQNSSEGTPGLVLKLIASARQDATLTVTNPQTGYSASFDVTANTIAEFEVPHEQGYTSRSGSVSQRGLRVTSTTPVSLYASNFQEHTYDATIVLPSAALGMDYIAQMYESDYGAKEIAIVATQDNTSLTIIPHARTTSWQEPDVPFAVHLNAGESYQIMSMDGSFSGTRIQSNSPIAVFAGHQCINIPAENRACDHIVEQQMPVNMWGKQFALTKTKGQNGDMVLITARDADTEVKLNGNLLTTLQALESHEFRLTDNSAFVETSGPAACYLYLEGAERNNYMGDPSSVHVSPIEQHVKQITFATFQTSISRTHYVNIVTTAAGAAALMLDEKRIDDEFSILTGNSNLRFAQIRIPHGTHTLRSNADGFTGHVYGLGNCESYAYTMGSSIRQLDGQILVDGEPRTDRIYDEIRCYKVPITFAPHANVDFNTIEWDFGDGQTSTQTTVTHTYASAGTYPVSMRITNEDGEHTAHTTLTLVETLRDTVRAFICEDETFSLAGQDFTTAGEHEVTLVSAGGCDSIVTLFLNVGQNYETAVSATFRKGSSYHWHNRWFREPGVYRDTIPTKYGCDSVFILTLTEIEATIEMQDTICWQPTYRFRGYDYPLPPVDEYRDRDYIDYTLEYFDKDECEHYRMDIAIVPKESGTYELYADIQDGEIYDFFGEPISITGVYTKTVRSACNCEQTYILHLETHSFPIERTEYALCHEDSYLFYGQTYTDPGVYSDTVFLETGIDAVRELTLTDNRTSSELHISNVESYNFNGEVITESGTYTATLTNAAGCDSIVTLYLQTILVIETQVQIEDPCAEEGTLDVRITRHGPVQQVQLRFDDAAQAAGLRDTLIDLTAEEIYTLPFRVKPGNFTASAELLVNGQVEQTIAVPFSVRYPAFILEQAWNDMVAVLAPDYNGGYNFVAFQWYENGVLLVGETRSYLYRPLIMGGEYSAMLTGPDGTQIMTCPLIAEPQPETSLYPTIAAPLQQIHCWVAQEAELRIFDTMGRALVCLSLLPGDNAIQAPSETGVYVVSVRDNGSQSAKTYKLIIQ